MWFVPIVLSPDATVVADDANLAAVAPRYRRDVRGREALELAGDLALDVTGELPGRGDKDRGRGRPVLRLAKQVGRDELRVGGFVRDHQDLGRAGEKVDSDATKQLPLRLDYVSVPGPGDEVDRLDRPSAERERRDRGNAAKAVDLIGTGQVHRRDRRRRELTRERRRARGHALDAGDLRRDDAHLRGGDHRIAPAPEHTSLRSRSGC